MRKNRKWPKHPKRPAQKPYSTVSPKKKFYKRSTDPRFKEVTDNPLAMLAVCSDNIELIEHNARKRLYIQLALIFKIAKELQYNYSHWRLFIADSFWDSWAKNRPTVNGQEKSIRYALMKVLNGHSHNRDAYSRAAKYATALTYLDAMAVEPEELADRLAEDGIEAVYKEAIAYRKSEKADAALKLAAAKYPDPTSSGIHGGDDDDVNVADLFDLGEGGSDLSDADAETDDERKNDEGNDGPQEQLLPVDVSRNLVLDWWQVPLTGFLRDENTRYSLTVERIYGGRGDWVEFKVLQATPLD